MNEQELCKKRLMDLSKQADRRGIVLFSDFLNLNEQNICQQNQKFFETKIQSFGGTDFAERQIIAFIPDALCYEMNFSSKDLLEYPITAIKIEPVHPKFAEKFGHRDVLGALMHLGIERGKIGDIYMNEDACYFICEKSIADFFITNLDKIKHTAVKLSRTSLKELKSVQKLKEMDGIVTSNRLDSMIACVFKLSRSQALELLRAGKVFVNGKEILNPSYEVKENEIVSLRGLGRFLFSGEVGTTGKGRIKIKYKLYES